MRYLPLDLEHGGFGGPTSLLTAYFQVIDGLFGPVMGELDLKVKPDNGVYQVTAGALKVNKINLIDHDLEAVAKSEAATAFLFFVREHSLNGKEKLVPVGQNVAGDLNFIDQNLIKKSSWADYVSYRVMDSGSNNALLKEAGLVPYDMEGSLGASVRYYGVDMDESLLHTAKGDALAALKVVRKQVKLLKALGKSIS